MTELTKVSPLVNRLVVTVSNVKCQTETVVLCLFFSLEQMRPCGREGKMITNYASLSDLLVYKRMSGKNKKTLRIRYRWSSLTVQ